jgi:hypothetical protein
MANRGPRIRPPAEGTEARDWWDKGAAAEAACRNEGLSADAISVRHTLEALGRLGDSDEAELAGSLATIYLADQPLRRRLALALQLVFR